MSNRSGSGKRRSSRLAAWASSSRALPAGTIWPWSSTSRATYRPMIGPGASNRSSSSIALAHERRVLHELAALVGMVAEHLAGPADEAVRRLVAGAGDDVDVEQRLVAGQASG